MTPRYRLAVLIALCAAAAACTPPDPGTDFRGMSDHFAFRISANPLPPHAREKTRYKIVVRDKDSGQPIQVGEGRIFASDSTHSLNPWDVLTRGPELGTYYSTLDFITPGNWALAVQFRRDSTQKLERVDWLQEVKNARGER